MTKTKKTAKRKTRVEAQDPSKRILPWQGVQAPKDVGKQRVSPMQNMKFNPDEFKKETGRCPPGYNSDEAGKCQKAASVSGSKKDGTTMKTTKPGAKPKAKTPAKKPASKKPGAAKPKKGATMKTKKKVSKRVAQLLKLEQVRVAKMQRRAADKPPTQAPLINAPDTKAKGKGGEPTKAPLIDTNPSTPQLKDKTAPAPKTPAPKRETGGPETPAVFDDQTDFTDVNDLGVKKGSAKRGVIAMIKAKAAGGASRRPFGR